MKKSIAMLLAIVMVFSILPISVFATETGGTITFATNFDNNLGKGDVFTVTATLSDNPGIASFTNMLKWNNEVVKFTGFTRKTTGNKIRLVKSLQMTLLQQVTPLVALLLLLIMITIFLAFCTQPTSKSLPKRVNWA